MKNVAVKRVLRKHFERLLPCYNNVPEDFELEEIHDFRLHIKKLNSFLWLLNGSKPEGRLKVKKPLHEFYNRVGKIRNLQLHRQRVGNLCTQLHLSSPPSYLQFVAQREAAERAEARKEALCLSIKKKIKKLLSAAPKKIKEATVKSFLIANLATVQNILKQAVLRDDDLHELRKILKRFLYVWKWIEAGAHSDFASPFLNKEICHRLSEALGDFMDSVFGLRFFETHPATGTTAEEDNVLQALQTQMASDKKRQYNALVSDLRNITEINRESEMFTSYAFIKATV